MIYLIIIYRLFIYYLIHFQFHCIHNVRKFKSYRVIFVSRVNIFFEVAFFFFLLDSLKNYNTVFIVLSRAISINLRRDFFFFFQEKREVVTLTKIIFPCSKSLNPKSGFIIDTPRHFVDALMPLHSLMTALIRMVLRYLRAKGRDEDGGKLVHGLNYSLCRGGKSDNRCCLLTCNRKGGGGEKKCSVIN